MLQPLYKNCYCTQKRTVGGKTFPRWSFFFLYNLPLMHHCDIKSQDWQSAVNVMLLNKQRKWTCIITCAPHMHWTWWDTRGKDIFATSPYFFSLLWWWKKSSALCLSLLFSVPICFLPSVSLSFYLLQPVALFSINLFISVFVPLFPFPLVFTFIFFLIALFPCLVFFLLPSHLYIFFPCLCLLPFITDSGGTEWLLTDASLCSRWSISPQHRGATAGGHGTCL